MSAALITNLGEAPSSSDVISKYLRAAISGGEFPESEVVNQEEIARLFNVSKIPVREALKRLEAEGFVTFHRNRGAIVTSLSRAEIAQVFQTRAILEVGAMRMSVPHLTKAALEQADIMRESFANETDVSKWAQSNWAFHSSLYAGAENPFLINLIRSVNDRVERHLRVQLTLADGMSKADREHRELLQACRRRDVERASKLVEEHVMDACHSLLANLPHRA